MGKVQKRSNTGDRKWNQGILVLKIEAAELEVAGSQFCDLALDLLHSMKL
jgi:hypothetical protein